MPFMQKVKAFLLVGLFAIALFNFNLLHAQPTLGDPPIAPKNVEGLPGGGSRPLDVTGGFIVNTTSREQVREFYNSVYTSSEGTPIDSIADTADCFAGTNSPVFAEVTLRRINWFRAMAGIPAAETFDSGENAEDQEAALMMSAQNELQHVEIPPTWNCFNTEGTNASANSNLALGNDGPDAITAYIWDNGANNYEVGHRRWILYPQTQIMGTGDVPQQGADNSANATWVFDANIFGSRPTTRTPYVSWPPAGYVPYQVVYPQWSFGLSNNYGAVVADFTNATVSMMSNGVPVSVTIQPYVAGYGENSLVWYPSSLDPATGATFPFSGSDTVYSITVANIKFGTATVSYTYNVTLFDPSVPGSDYFPTTVNGPNQPAVGANNSYNCTPATNPNTTSYQWLTAQSTNGNLVDNAQNGLVNFTISPTPIYPVITNPPVGSGYCFHLTHTNPVPQLLQLNELLFPSNNTTVSFKSLLGYAESAETARVQVSTDGGTTWQDIFTEAGSNGAGESAFTPYTLSLSNYVGEQVMLRFNYDYSSGGYYYYEIDPYVGWCIENVVVTNAQQLVNFATNSTVSTNFMFTPTQTGNYVLQARGLIFTEFPLDWGPAKQVNAIVGASSVITLSAPVVSDNQVQINFTVAGSASTFELLQADQINGMWTTNTSASLTTLVSGSSYRFTTTSTAAARFYRVHSP